MKGLKETHFDFPGQTGFYRGKVRDVYYFGGTMAMVATDRISAFDVVLPRAIPFKGQVLNQIAWHNLRQTEDIVGNWVDHTPHPNVSIGKKCDPFKVEMVVRGYLAGHAWREYRSGKRTLCGVALPEGMKENDRFPSPIITPATKADEGHDEDISREDILKKGIVSEEDYNQLEQYTYRLFQRGSDLADQKGLILVDTKYEFGKYAGEVLLIDEIHTPDSSRYFYKEGYQERQDTGEKQKQLSKEFVREWLIENGFQGKTGQTVPEMTDEIVNLITNRYLELFSKLTGTELQKGDDPNMEKTIEQSINNTLSL